MDPWPPGKAALTALTASASALLGVIALSSIMRNGLAGIHFPDLPKSTQAQVTPERLTADAGQGRHLFLMNCAHCHGEDAHGDEGPDLFNLHKSDARIHQVITAGIKGEMPSFGTKLGEADVRALTAYLRTLHS